MLNQVYCDEDVSLDALKDKVVAVLGYGIQGEPQALCMRDSGVNVIIGAGPKDQHRDWHRAEKDGFEVFDFAEATRKADVVHLLLPDPAQPKIFEESIRNNLKPGSTLSFCHGFNVLYGAISAPDNVNVVLYVPNSPGHLVREKYLEGSGIYGAIAVDQDVTGDAKDIVLALAKSVGSTRVGTVEVDFVTETEGDNFEEQSLYGGTIALMRAVFDEMVDHGYPALFAYAKCIRSLRSVLEVMDDVGIEEYISKRGSRTMEFAVRMSGPRAINRQEISNIFEETSRGEFAANWMQEWQLGMPRLHRMRRTGCESEMEIVGREWRGLFGDG
jgi:ketol-acid reductoisomerase